MCDSLLELHCLLITTWQSRFSSRYAHPRFSIQFLDSRPKNALPMSCIAHIILCIWILRPTTIQSYAVSTTHVDFVRRPYRILFSPYLSCLHGTVLLQLCAGYRVLNGFISKDSLGFTWSQTFPPTAAILCSGLDQLRPKICSCFLIVHRQCATPCNYL